MCINLSHKENQVMLKKGKRKQKKRKRRGTKYFQNDLESSPERLEQWKNGEVFGGERRILFTKWLADAWED